MTAPRTPRGSASPARVPQPTARGPASAGPLAVYRIGDQKAPLELLLGPTGDLGLSAASAWSCTGSGTQAGSNITLDFGESATCTLTNNDVAPILRLVKTVTNDSGRTELATAWTLTATGSLASPTDLSGTTPVVSGAGFKADTYTLGETGPSGYTASAWTCVHTNDTATSVAVTNSQVSVVVGQDITCTIVNDDDRAAPTLITLIIPNDQATLSGFVSGASLAGSITFELFGPDDASCSGTPWFAEAIQDVDSAGPWATSNTTPIGLDEQGTYRWKVSYSGDANNASAESPCGAERLTVAYGSED